MLMLKILGATIQNLAIYAPGTGCQSYYC